MSRGMRIVALMGVFLIVGLLFRDAVNNVANGAINDTSPVEKSTSFAKEENREQEETILSGSVPFL
jgi:hypothetical protein